MPIEQKLIRCDGPSDPERCQATGKTGQCPYKAMPGYKICQRHAGQTLGGEAKQRSNQYRLQVWQTRVDEFAENDNVKSLRDEIGILRMLMEETLNQCKTATDLMIYQSKLSNLAMQIEKLVTSCNRLEMKMGMLLDKSAALSLAGQIVDIISSEIDDPEVIDRISNGIINALASLTGSKENG